MNKALGLDPDSGSGDWPDGMVAHSAGLNEDGHLVVIEVWDTPEHQARFMEERLGAALAEGGVTEPPSSVTWIELVAHQRAPRAEPRGRAHRRALGLGYPTPSDTSNTARATAATTSARWRLSARPCTTWVRSCP